MRYEGKKSENLMGISNDTLKNRHRKNVITLTGQFFSFALETIFVIVYLSLLESGITTYGAHVPFTALLIFTFFLSSPELRRFYFNK